MRAKTLPIKPFLKWAGGKRQLLPEIRCHIPKFATYFEPFVGAGAVFFALQPAKAVIGDYNTQLIHTYSAIKEQLANISDLLREHTDKCSKEYFYAIRELDRDNGCFADLTNTQVAARFIFMNKTCYNGLYRVNSQGLFNVPYGKYKKPLIYERATLQAVSDYLNSADVKLLAGDFAYTVSTAQNGDFVYFDPPYHSSGNTNFTGYQARGFGESEQIRLQNCFADLGKAGVNCLLSNADTPFIRELYKEFTVILVPAKRLINTKPQGRGFVGELLIKNF